MSMWRRDQRATSPWSGARTRRLIETPTWYVPPLRRLRRHFTAGHLRDPAASTARAREIGTLGATGYDEAGLAAAIDDEVDLETFFDRAPAMNPDAALITGVICGHRVEAIEDPLMQRIRYMDKLVDEVARGKKMDSILRR